MTIPLTHTLQTEKCTRQSTRTIRKNVSLVFKKLLGSRCWEILLLNKLVDILISNTQILNEGNVKLQINLAGVNLEVRFNFDFHVKTH